VPGSGEPSLDVIAILATLNESNILASYSSTKPAMATTSTISLIQFDRVRSRGII